MRENVFAAVHRQTSTKFAYCLAPLPVSISHLTSSVVVFLGYLQIQVEDNRPQLPTTWL